MLHTNIKTLGLMVSDKNIFLSFIYISLCKTCDLRGVTMHLWPQGDDLNILDRGPISDATYQISKLMWFKRRRFLKFSS